MENNGFEKKINGNGKLDIRILGVGQTRFGELWGASLIDLAVEASREAIRDSGTSIKEIDAVVVGNMLGSHLDNQSHLGALVTAGLGIKASGVRVEGACASGGLAIATGIEKLISGTARKVLVVGAEKMTDYSTDFSTQALMGASDGDEQLAGITFPGLYALVTRAYMEEYGVADSELASIPVKNHMHGSLNPKAHFRFTIDVEQVLKSPCIASPIKLLDCSPISDGAAAVVLGLGKRRGGRNVRIIGFGQGNDEVGLASRRSLIEFGASKEASKKAFSMAGVEPKDIDVMEVHDCFSIGEVLALEDMGFSRKGEGWVIAGNGECKLGGRRPVNTSGGLKACGHPISATGVKQLVELTRQLRGVNGSRQVEGARIGLAHNVGGVGGTAIVHILESGI